MSNKRRVMAVLQYLREETNEDHVVRSEDIITYLNNVEKIKVERKTVYNDIKEITEMGYNIEKSYDGYYFDGELFELAELRVLIDEIKASSFLTDARTDDIEKKLLSLTNKHNREILSSGNYRGNKTDNKQILYNIDAILKAIEKQQVVTFKYYDLAVNKEKIYRKKTYRVSPYALVINNNKYYLICTTEGHNELSNYRIDKMEKVKSVTSSGYIENKIDIKDYMDKTFSMYNGESKTATLCSKKRLLTEIENHFGKNVMVIGEDDQTVTVNVKVNASPVFYGWLFAFGGDIKIVGPEDLKRDYIKMCSDMIDMYK